MSTGSRGAPLFENAVVIRGRVVEKPERIPGDNLQARFTIAWPVRANKAYFFEVNVFDELATWALDGNRKSFALGRGDEVLLQGALSSYSKPVTGQKGKFHITRVSINAKDVTRLKLGKNRQIAEE